MISNQLKAMCAIALAAAVAEPGPSKSSFDPAGHIEYQDDRSRRFEGDKKLAAHYREERLRRKAENFKKRMPKKDKS